MIGTLPAFSGFSTNDIDAERASTPRCSASHVIEEMGIAQPRSSPAASASSSTPRPNHEPATFTVLNFEVPDIDAAVDELTSRGVTFERYEGMGQDDEGWSAPTAR